MIFSYLRSIEAVFNISKFSKWPPFWARDKLFFTGSDTWSWIYFEMLNTASIWPQIWEDRPVQAGGNDIEHHRTDLVVKEYGTLIKALKSQCPKSNIVLCKIPCRSPFQWLHEEIARVNTFLANSTHGGNVHFIDSCPEFGPRYFRKDMVHFNHEGLQVYGDKVACSLFF